MPKKRGRPYKASATCPYCGRILLPWRGLWPAHINPATRKFCSHGDKPWPKPTDRSKPWPKPTDRS